MTPEEAQAFCGHNQNRLDLLDGPFKDAVETIAGMTWEYAVQLDFGNRQVFFVRAGITTRYPHNALWTDSKLELESIKTGCETYYGVPVTIVRRMVTTP